MRTISRSLRLALCSFLAAVALAPSLARAEDSDGARGEHTPILVVVESADAYGNVGKIRAGIARELGTPAVSLIEAQGRATVGTLQVAIARGGTRASIHYVPSDGVAYAVLINVAAEGRADRAGEWLVAPCASAVRTSDQRRSAHESTAELLDPWLRARTHAGPIATEVIDPFVGDPPRRVRVTVSDYFLGPEVLDPWADVVAEYQREQAVVHTPRPAPRRSRTSAADAHARPTPASRANPANGRTNGGNGRTNGAVGRTEAPR